MIQWTDLENGTGRFSSATAFQNEDGPQMEVYANQALDGFQARAERCVAAFNALSDGAVREICMGLIACAREGGEDEDFQLPALDDPRDILRHCWFVALYVDSGDDAAFAVEGEGEWGSLVGFYVRVGQVVYVGSDYLDYMEDA